MNTQTIDILLVAAAFGTTGIWFIITATFKRFRPPSNLAYWSVALAVAGLLIGQDGIYGYALIGAGVLLTLLDIGIKFIDKPDKPEN
jgi:hypothetical protein